MHCLIWKRAPRKDQSTVINILSHLLSRCCGLSALPPRALRARGLHIILFSSQLFYSRILFFSPNYSLGNCLLFFSWLKDRFLPRRVSIYLAFPHAGLKLCEIEVGPKETNTTMARHLSQNSRSPDYSFSQRLAISLDTYS